MKRIGRIALLSALAPCSAARAGDSGEVRVIANIPPCIDLVLLGHMCSHGDPEPGFIPDARLLAVTCLVNSAPNR